MFPFRYNNGVQIIQAPRLLDPQHGDDPRSAHHPDQRSGRALVQGEAVDGRVARGHWEGPEKRRSSSKTTNFKAGASSDEHRRRGLRRRAIASRPSEKMKITERMTRMERSDDALRDHDGGPGRAHASRGRGRFPLKLDNGYKWWEYACIEGNRTIPGLPSAPRARSAHRPRKTRANNRQEGQEGQGGTGRGRESRSSHPALPALSRPSRRSRPSCLSIRPRHFADTQTARHARRLKRRTGLVGRLIRGGICRDSSG